MQVILLQSVRNLGNQGDVVTVKDGYARNYLLPNEIAATVSADSLIRAEELRKKFVQQEMERLEILREKAARLGTVSITIQAKASEEGHLFGSVGAHQILESLEKEGFELEAKSIKLEENIKAVGVYTVPVQLHPEIQAEVKVWVVEEKAAEEGAEGAEESGEPAGGPAGETSGGSAGDEES